MIDNFEQWSKRAKHDIPINESAAQHLANRVMYKFKFRKLKFDHIANEHIFAKSLENFFDILFKTPEMKKFKNLFKEDNSAREEIANIVYTFAHRAKSELNSMGKIKPEENDIIEYLKGSFQQIFKVTSEYAESLKKK